MRVGFGLATFSNRPGQLLDEVASDEKSVRLLGEMAGTLTPEVPAPGRPGMQMVPSSPPDSASRELWAGWV